MAAPKQIQNNAKIAGLATNPSFLDIPAGATAIAENVTFNREGMAVGRRGFTYHTTHAAQVDSILDYQNNLLIHTADGSLSWNTTADTTVNTFTGTFQAPAGAGAIRGVDSRGNFYLTDIRGPQKLAGVLGSFRAAGMPPGLDLEASTTGTSGFLGAGKSTAYRVTWTSTDSNGVIVEGAPSPLTTVTNGGAAGANVAVKFSVPAGVQSGDTWKLYRAAQITGTPQDTLYLAASGTWTSGAEVTVTDTALDALLVQPCYTNQEEDGITGANWVLPACRDVAVFKERTYFGYATTRWTKVLTLVSEAGGLVDNTSAVTITDGTTTRTYTFSTAEDFTANKFRRFTSGTASANIAATMRSFARCVNQDAAGEWWAIYASGADDQPGIVTIMSRSLTAPAFSLTADAGTTGDNFSPVLPTSGTSVTATRDDKPARLYYSKPQEPEHVPLLNYLDIGRSDKAILRLVALKDSLFVVKEDGIFTLSHSDPAAGYEVLDDTVFCLAAQSVVKLNNEIFMLSNQGFVRVSPAGAVVISDPIEIDIRGKLDFPNLDIAVAAGFERDRLYACWLPDTSDDTVPQTAWCYNVFRLEWSTWTKPASAAGVVHDKFFLGSGWENRVLVQRDSGTAADLSDETIPVVITDVIGSQVVLEYGFTHTPLTTGFSLHQGSAVAKVTGVTKAGTSHTLDLDGTAAVFEPGPATVRVPIPIRVRHHPNTCGSPGVTKSFLDFGFVLDRNTVSQVTLEVVSNENGILTLIPITRTPDQDFGNSPWGSSVWGDSATLRSIPLRENVPNQHATGEWLTVGIHHRVSGEKFGLVYSYISFQVATDVSAAGN